MSAHGSVGYSTSVETVSCGALQVRAPAYLELFICTVYLVLCDLAVLLLLVVMTRIIAQVIAPWRRTK